MGSTSKGHSTMTGGGPNPLLRYARSSNASIVIMTLVFIFGGFGVGFLASQSLGGGGSTSGAPTDSSATAALRRELSNVDVDANSIHDEVKAHSGHAINQEAVEEFMAAFSKDRLIRIADNHHNQYAAGAPFPHLAIDELFPLAMVREVEKEVPEDQVGEDGCYKGVPKNKCYKHDKSFKKTGIAQDDLMGPHTRIFMAMLKSANFVTFLEHLTGIEHIIPDPRFYGSGVHVIAPGGFLGVHADFNWSPALKLHRRVNAFVMLNPDWDEDWGGHLEFWNKDMNECHERIAPSLGRFAVFSSTDFTYHGHPNPLEAPPGRARRSMALYYYTTERPDDECADQDCSKHNTFTMHQDIRGDCAKCTDAACNFLPTESGVVTATA